MTKFPSWPGIEIRNVDLEGQRLRVATRTGAASGPPLLMFNGIGANLELVMPFVTALADIDVVIFDVPGVGGSPLPRRPYRLAGLARLADRLMTRLGHGGAIDVLGVSWGGGVAQQFARLHPGRCRRLVLAATSPGMLMVPGGPSILLKMSSPLRYLDRNAMMRMGAGLYGGRYRQDPGLLRDHARHIQPPRGLGYLYQLLAMLGWTSLFWLHRLTQPTLVLAGNDDPIVPLVNARILARLIPKSELVVIDDGHLFLAARAAEVAPLVARFLRPAS